MATHIPKDLRIDVLSWNSESYFYVVEIGYIHNAIAAKGTTSIHFWAVVFKKGSGPEQRFNP